MSELEEQTPKDRTRDRSELGVVVLLVVLGGLVLWDASQIRSGVAQVGAVGPKAVPYLVGGMLIVCAVVLAVDVLRGGRGEAEGGEDIDLSHPSDWRTVLLLVAAFLANVVLIEPVGWWFSGAVLFWGCAWAARPALAILLPSMAVTTEALSPGVLSRIEVVDPPYIPP